MRTQDHGISTLEKDALFKLLPRIIQARDTGSIKAILEAAVSKRNEFAKLISELGKVYDPRESMKFSPESLGESKELYQEWIKLVRRNSRNIYQEERFKRLTEALPLSSKAYYRERRVLSLIAENLGETTSMVSIGLNPRGFLETSIPRRHIKGTQANMNAIGMASGLFDVSVSELWSRFSLKNPTDPRSQENDGDFSYVPDQYPNAYPSQYPPGNPQYDPLNLSDYPHRYVVKYQYCTPDQKSPLWFNSQIDDRNPFGRFQSWVTQNLVIGTYRLSGGTDRTRAFVPIKTTSGNSVIFEAITFGEFGNEVVMEVSYDQFGTQTIQLSGPQSLIKFKSSMFDLTMAVDFDRFISIYQPTLVTRNSSESFLDDQLSRVLPEYPVTSDGDTFILSSPDLGHYCLDMDGLNNMAGIIRQLLEDSRPMTRTIRRERTGFSLKDQVFYAPVLYTNLVVLASESKHWKVVLDGGLPRFVETSPEPTTEVFQRDIYSGKPYQWAVNDQGQWSPILLTNLQFSTKPNLVVMVEDQRLFIENYHLVARFQDGSFQDEIHLDGTADELNLRFQYSKVVENPSQVCSPYMSEGAVSQDKPSNLLLQQSPEDDLTAVPTLVDFYTSHLDPHLGTEEESGSGGGNVFYWPNGRFDGSDIRSRQTGPTSGLIEPVPTGKLTYGHPVSFLTYANKVVWRDRVSNIASQGQYSYNTPDEITGASFESSQMAHDGPIEGSSKVSSGSEQIIPSIGDGCTPNDQVPIGFGVDMLVLKRLFRGFEPHLSYFSVEDSNGTARITFRSRHNLFIGEHLFFPLSSSYSGVTRILRSGLDWVEIDRVFTEVENGSFMKLVGEMQIMQTQSITITVKKTRSLGNSTLTVAFRQPWSNSFTILDAFTILGDEETVSVSVPTTCEISVFVGGRSPLSLTIEAPTNDFSGLPGLLTSSGSRVDVGLTITESEEEHFWNYDQGDGNDYIMVDGMEIWRGGRWRGANSYNLISEDRDGLPATLYRLIEISPTTVPNIELGTFGSVQFTSDAGTVEIWSIAFGNVPSGMTFSDSGLLSGTPITPGVSTFGIKVEDADGNHNTIAISLLVTVGLQVIPASVPNPTFEDPYLQELIAIGGVGPYTFNPVDSLPPGLIAIQTDDDVLVLSGTINPGDTEAGVYPFQITVYDDNGDSHTQNYSITVPLPTQDAFRTSSGILKLEIA